MTAARRDGGYTLVELLVVMVIFGIVMSLITVSFNRIVSSSGQLIKGVETDIGGLIGLELLRVDLALAGFGLPWELGGASYAEAAPHQVDGYPMTSAELYNDGPGRAPTAYLLGDNAGFKGSDYLVLKGAALGGTTTARGWSYLNYSSVGFTIKPAKSDAELRPGSGDRVIVVNTGARSGELRRDLVTKRDGETVFFSTPFETKERFDTAFVPKNREDRFLVYGISNDSVSFPFNRVDYFIKSPDKGSKICAPGTGVLYKGVIGQGSAKSSGGSMSSFPILDCVLDMQVVFLVDLEHDGNLTQQNLADYRKTVLMQGRDPAEAVREHVKEVHVYILAQQGKRDESFSYPVRDPARVFVLADPQADAEGRVWTDAELTEKLGASWRHYHWKVYTIVEQPKNLQ